MPDSPILFSVFTKPWKTQPLEELCALVHDMGFDAVELTVRDGYQVQPATIAKGLPLAVKAFADNGVKITSLAVTPDERVMAAASENGIPLLRIMVKAGPEGYTASEAKAQKEFDALVPLLDKYKVTLGIQNHSDGYLASGAAGLRALVGKYDKKHVAAVWDCAHCALQGENPELALDIIWPHLAMVNYKNGIWRSTTPPEAEYQKWDRYWTGGRFGLANWPKVTELLKKRNYQGVITLTAEYGDEKSVNRLIREDIHWARSLFA